MRCSREKAVKSDSSSGFQAMKKIECGDQNLIEYCAVEWVQVNIQKYDTGQILKKIYKFNEKAKNESEKV